MKKKLVSTLLVTCMAASLIACGDSKSEEKTPAVSSTEPVSAEAAVIDMEEDAYPVAIQVVILPGQDYSSLEADMEAKLNAITEPAINCTVDLQFVSIAEVSQKTSLGIAGNEKLDLLHVGTVTPLSAMVGSDLLYDMNEDNLIATRGQDLVELFGWDAIKSGEVDGHQLAIPAKNLNATTKGIYYNKTAADAIGLEVPEKGTLADVEDILVQFSEKKVGTEYEDMMPLFQGQGTGNYIYWLVGYAGFGTDAAYGVIFDEENLTVENLYASDTFKNFYLDMLHLKQKGAYKSDSTDSSNSQDYFNAGQLFAVVADLTPQIEANDTSRANLAGIDIGFMYTTDPIINNASSTEYMWGIAANCERPDKAMDFLNFMYCNDEVANIINYGIEGQTYELNEAGSVVPNGSYMATFFAGGNQKGILPQAPEDTSIYDKWDAFQAAATVSPMLGYMFDDTEFQAEASVIATKIAEYMPQIFDPQVTTDEELLAIIEEFNTELSKAGMDDIIAENQAQLDAFMANK